MLANKIEEKTLSYTIFRARSVKSRTRCVHDADRARVCRGLKTAPFYEIFNCLTFLTVNVIYQL